MTATVLDGKATLAAVKDELRARVAALAAAGRGEAVVEVIADGVHLAAGTVQMLFDTVGPGQLALVSDCMSAAGLPDGDWFIITPVSAGGERIVLMRHIGTRGGRVSVTL